MYQNDDVDDDDSVEMIGACIWMLTLLGWVGLNESNIKPFLIAWDKTISVLPIALNRYISSAARHFHCIKSHTVVLTRQNELFISDIVIIDSTSGWLVP